MEFYFVTKDHHISLPIDGQEVTYVFLAASPEAVPVDRLYFAPSDEIGRVVNRFREAGYKDFEVRVLQRKDLVRGHPKFPLDLTYSGGNYRVLVERAGLSVLCQWAVPPLPGDIMRALEDDLRVPDVNLELGEGRSIQIPGEKFKPVVQRVFSSLGPLLQEQGLFLVTVAQKT